MIKIIKGAEVYTPSYIGKKDVLIVGDKIEAVEEEIIVESNCAHIEMINGYDQYLVPGFIDAHVHIMGGGGEGSYRTRTPEMTLTDATTSGITTVVGVIGTDGTTRTMASLLAKCRALEEEGITSYIYTGSYQVPVKTLTDTIENDLILIDKIIGSGEIAIADHRSSQPTFEEMAKIASASRIGGMLSGKSGIVNIHVGAGKSKLSLLEKVVDETDIPITQFYPTHINRNREVFEEGVRWALKGGYVDFTTSTVQRFLSNGEVSCATALSEMLKAGVSLDQITFTSDAQGSLPEFNENGDLIGLQVGKLSSLFEAVKKAVVDYNIPLEQALAVITKNPAKILKLNNKGEIQKGKDADLLLLDKNLTIMSVFAKGNVMIKDKQIIVKGTFE